MDWHVYFREYRLQRDGMEADAAEHVTDKVLVPGHAIPLDELPKTVKAVADMMPGAVARHSQTWHEGRVFKSGARQGEKRPDKTIDHYAIAWKGERPLTAVWSDGKMQYAKGWDGTELFWTESVNELKARIKGGWNG